MFIFLYKPLDFYKNLIYLCNINGNKSNRKHKSNNFFKMQLSQQIYQGLRRHYGSMSEVCERLRKQREPEGREGFSRQWVRLVLQGKYSDPEVVQVAATVWKEYEERAAELRNRTHQISLQAKRLAASY
jgi:hypothetical protein